MFEDNFFLYSPLIARLKVCSSRITQYAPKNAGKSTLSKKYQRMVSWLEYKGSTLKYSVHSLENTCGIIVLLVYRDEHQYQNTADLKITIKL